MLKSLFGQRHARSEAAKFCVSLVQRTRIEAGHEGDRLSLPAVYATHFEFMGCLLGLIEYMVHQLGDSTPTRAVVREVVEALFGSNAAKAMDTIQAGIDSPILARALEDTQRHLEWVKSRPRAETEQHLLFLKRFF